MEADPHRKAPRLHQTDGPSVSKQEEVEGGRLIAKQRIMDVDDDFSRAGPSGMSLDDLGEQHLAQKNPPVSSTPS